MTNCYKNYLDDFFSTLLEYRHSTNRLNKVLKKDVEIYTKKGAVIHSSSALIVSDWSGPTDNGWELNFHTGIFKETTKDNYESEIDKILSREFCLMYSQSFEALETFLKNCLFNKQLKDEDLKNYIISLNNQENYKLSRESMPGGEKLFSILKKAGGKTFKDFSKQNNKTIKFTELWTVLSETRNSITHSSSKIKKSKLNRSKHHFAIFEYLFDSSEIEDSYLLIELDYHKFDKLIKSISEFAFQILKTLSIEEKIEWNVY